jgi:hypothetical protein
LSNAGRTLLISSLLASLCLLSCAGAARIPPADLKAGRVTALYRVQIEGGGKETRKFRLLLYAAPPDRLHAEALSAVGSTEVIVDGGGGRISVAVVRDNVAYVGEAAPETMQKLIGVALSLDDLVSALLTGECDTETVDMERIPERDRGLPQFLRISAKGREARFKLKRLRPMPARQAGLGTGAPPPLMKTLPLDELDGLELSGS